MIPTIQNVSVIKMIKLHREKYYKLVKYSAERRAVDPVKTEIEKFLEENNSIFDISYCNCALFKKCCCPVLKNCLKASKSF